MEKRKTCAGCGHLNSVRVHNVIVYGCKMTDLVVPHHTDQVQATFYNVPESCPLADDIVERQAGKQSESEWVTIEHAVAS